MRRVIVTGANGFVGCNIVSALSETGWYVSAVDLDFDNPAVATWDQSRVKALRANCADMPSIAADALVHAAFVTARPEERREAPEDNLRANLEPLLQVLEYAEAQGIRRSAFISSSAVYGHSPATAIDETRPPQPSNVYGLAKTVMEYTVETMRDAHGRDIFCARLGSVYGSYEFQRDTRPRLSIVAQMMGDALSRGEIVVAAPALSRQWTLAADIGRALSALLDADSLSYSLYNLASNERKTNLEVAQMIQGLLPGVSLRLTPESKGKQTPVSGLGWLDNSRLSRDTGFGDWTAMSRDSLATVLASLAGSDSHA